MTTFQVAERVKPSLPARASSTLAGRTLLQRKCACGGTPGPTGECEQCRKKRLSVQRLASDNALPSVAPPVVYDVLRSPGQPLDTGTRGYFERRFSHDFSRVRVHVDAQAAESARSVHALAYTVGQNIVFNQGQYSPAAPTGQELLAHELTHVVQQSGGGAGRPEPATTGLIIAPAEGRLEAEANLSARAIMNPSWGSLPRTAGGARQSGPALQRQSETLPPTASESAADARLRALAGRPAEALRAWKTLNAAERSFVLMVMTGRYGVDFALEFSQYSQGKKKPDFSTTVTNKETPESLTGQGYRHFGDPGGIPRWVHPSGREVMLLSPPAPEPEERSPAEVERCEQMCADTDDEDACNACCDEKIPESDHACRVNCKVKCPAK